MSPPAGSNRGEPGGAGESEEGANCLRLGRERREGEPEASLSSIRSLSSGRPAEAENVQQRAL